MYYDFRCSTLTGITLPEGLERIGESAFYDCESLSYINYPSGVKYVGSSAFKGCRRLADKDGFIIVGSVLYEYMGAGGDVVVPEGVEVLDDYSFQRCNVTQMGHVEVRSITLPGSLKRIGNNVFSRCDSLKEVIVPENVTEIGDCAFERCRWLEKVTLPDNLTHIGGAAFFGCSINTINLPKCLNSVGANALSGNHLRELILPDGIETIEKNAFGGGLYGDLILIVNRGSKTEAAITQYKKKNKPE